MDNALVVQQRRRARALLQGGGGGLRHSNGTQFDTTIFQQVETLRTMELRRAQFDAAVFQHVMGQLHCAASLDGAIAMCTSVTAVTSYALEIGSFSGPRALLMHVLFLIWRAQTSDAAASRT